MTIEPSIGWIVIHLDTSRSPMGGFPRLAPHVPTSRHRLTENPTCFGSHAVTLSVHRVQTVIPERGTLLAIYSKRGRRSVATATGAVLG